MAIIIRSVTNHTPYTLALKIPGLEQNLTPVIVAPSATLDLLTVVTEDDLIAMQLYLQGMVSRGNFSVAATFDTSTLESGYGGGGGGPATSFQISASDPIGPTTGTVYFNTSTFQFKGWNGSSWVILG